MMESVRTDPIDNDSLAHPDMTSGFHSDHMSLDSVRGTVEQGALGLNRMQHVLKPGMINDPTSPTLVRAPTLGLRGTKSSFIMTQKTLN
jgi:hypothetical protein